MNYKVTIKFDYVDQIEEYNPTKIQVQKEFEKLLSDFQSKYGCVAVDREVIVKQAK